MRQLSRFRCRADTGEIKDDDMVPFPPRGTTDVLARLLQSNLQTKLGRIVLMENKSGAAGSLGAAVVAKSAQMARRFS